MDPQPPYWMDPHHARIAWGISGQDTGVSGVLFSLISPPKINVEIWIQKDKKEVSFPLSLPTLAFSTPFLRTRRQLSRGQCQQGGGQEAKRGRESLARRQHITSATLQGAGGGWAFVPCPESEWPLRGVKGGALPGQVGGPITGVFRCIQQSLLGVERVDTGGLDRGRR